MQLHGLPFSDKVRVNICDIEDYFVKGSFSPNAACDIEYYGCRETNFTVESAEVKTSTGWWPMLDDEVRELARYNDSALTLLVQNAIDDKQGEL